MSRECSPPRVCPGPWLLGVVMRTVDCGECPDGLGGEGIAMIEFDLGDEPEFEDLDLVSDERYRGPGDDAGLEPLKGRVKIGGPRGFEITEARVAGDEGLRRFVEEGNRQVAYY